MCVDVDDDEQNMLVGKVCTVCPPPNRISIEFVAG